MCAVNRVQLGDLLDYEQPTRYIVSSTDYDDAYDTPVLTAGQTFILGYTNETEGIYKASKSNPVIIFDDFVTSFYLVDFDFKVKSSALKILKPKKDVNIYYVYYAMLGISFVPKEHARHWISKYSQFEIAYPSLAKQQEIVSQLDTFTTLISNLESELDMRRKQYEHYRNQLLDFEGVEGVEWKTLGEVCIKTENIKWKNATNDYYYIDLSSVERESNRITEVQSICKDNAPSRAQQIVLRNDILFGTTRPTLKRLCIVPQEYDNQICSTGFCVLRANINVISHRLLYYLLTTMSFYKYVENNQEGAGYPSISNSKIMKYEVPIPSLNTQREIVEKLDAFENLIQSLEQEIKLRKQQYEYYREKLLTFE